MRARIDTALEGCRSRRRHQSGEFVGPQVGDELRNSAIKALSITLVLVFLYLIFRFHTWRLSAGAILRCCMTPS